MSATVKHTSVHELYQHIKDGDDVVIIDCRQPDEYTGPLGHVPGSRLIPLSQVASAELDIAQDTPIRVICRTGGRSIPGAKRIKDRGFSDVASVDGGMVEWNRHGYPVEKS